MFSKNLIAYRKKKGYTQEELAIRINVVRQTVSKWEKGLSVPDADMLIRLAEVLEVTVGELLGIADHSEQTEDPIVEQLSRINEQLAIKNRRARRVWKIIGITALVIFLLNLMIIIFSCSAFTVLRGTNTAVVGAEEVIVEEVPAQE